MKSKDKHTSTLLVDSPLSSYLPLPPVFAARCVCPNIAGSRPQLANHVFVVVTLHFGAILRISHNHLPMSPYLNLSDFCRNRKLENQLVIKMPKYKDNAF